MTRQLPFGGAAVMAQRREPPDGIDDFPTPPWATRALVEIVLPRTGISHIMPDRHILEPACNRGIMARVLKEYVATVSAADIFPYGYSNVVEDYLTSDSYDADMIITNPPFNKALEFAKKAIEEASELVALLLRTQWVEGVERYDQLFSKTPPTLIAQFVERVPMVKGRWDPQADTMTSYAWFVWRRDVTAGGDPAFVWIPPGQRELLTRLDDAARFCEVAPAPLLDGIA